MEPRQQELATPTTEATESVPYERSPLHHEAPYHTNIEAMPSHPELDTVQAEAAQAVIPSLPAPITPVAAAVSTHGASSDDIPIVASDDDLIEKEWVDKAKKVIAETKDDPYRREREISKLQIEYIRRRYGREIGDSGD